MAQPQQQGHETSVEELRSIFSRSLSPDVNIRREAENHLQTSAQSSPSHALTVLRIVASNDAIDAPVRQAAAVHFKNLVKSRWASEDVDGPPTTVSFSPENRTMIKKHLVDLMCEVPPNIRSQCSESISLIAFSDFPSRWDDLLPGLVGKFGSNNPVVVEGVLLTANSILKRFRFVERSDALYSDILYTLNHIQAPLLALFQRLSNEVAGSAVSVQDVETLKTKFSCLRAICRIFYSLNWQDLPEFFEDHMSEWMEPFATFLQYQNPLLVDEDEETEPSPIDLLQVAIIENLHLYADKDEEPFLPFLPKVASLVWNLLLTVGEKEKSDSLATTAIRFLAGLVSKLMHKELFKEEETLKQIVGRIVVPNLMIREVDEERFEEDPQDFILGDMEDSDTESRRKCSQELLKATCRHFEGETTKICSEHVGTMLGAFQHDPTRNWSSKDTAIHLMFGISIRAQSAQHGVSSVNPEVDVMSFFTSHILPELGENDMSVRPMVKASCLKFVGTFRNQFTREHLVGLMPYVINHLGSPSVVVHTYAAASIEKILVCKEVSPKMDTRVPKFGSAELQPFLQSLFGALFTIVDDTSKNENEYVMKCIMRSVAAAGDDILPVTQIVIGKLTAALAHVAKNPRNPQFNHYLFESIAILVRSVCKKDSAHVPSFESLLFFPFQTVLQMEVLELTPYVFQVLAQLLEYRSVKEGLGEAYSTLFPPLLTPLLWERKGNVPALTRLLRGYLGIGAAQLASEGHLVGILGVFQKLVSSRLNETNAFDLLVSIITKVPVEALGTHLRQIFQILLTRLQQGKTERYVRLITDFFSVFIGKFGAQNFLERLNEIQSGLGLMILNQVWMPRLEESLPVRMEAKYQVIGLTKILCETGPALFSGEDGKGVWFLAFKGLMMVISNSKTFTDISSADIDMDVEMEIGYDATYSRLVFATRPVEDYFSEIPDVALYFAQSTKSLCESLPGQVAPLIQQGLKPHPKLEASFKSLIENAGVSLV